MHDASDARVCSTQPTSIASGTPSHTIAVDDTDVYWIDTRDALNVLERTPKAGGATSDVATDVLAFAIDTNAIYYGVTSYDDGGFDSAIYSLPKADGGAPNLVTSNAGGIDFALDDTTIYFASAGSIQSIPKSGGTPQAIASGALVGVDDASVYSISSTTSTATIWATPKTGGTSVQLAQVQALVNRAALDGGDIYFTDSNGELAKLTIATSTVTTLASGLGTLGGELSVRSGLVFVSQQDIGHYPAIILAVPTDGGPARDTCGGGSLGVSGIAADDTAIYWGLLYEATGQLMKIPR